MAKMAIAVMFRSLIQVNGVNGVPLNPKGKLVFCRVDISPAIAQSTVYCSGLSPRCSVDLAAHIVLSHKTAPPVCIVISYRIS